MSLKDSIVKKLETQSNAWTKKIDSLRAQAEEKMAKAEDEQAEARIQQEFTEQIQKLEENVEKARTRMNEAKDAGEDKIADLKKRVDEWLPSNTN
ncbi:hypothetical protein C8D92_1081 [Tamilnaduibacter salinus]|uniref:Coiled coil domain-containing protein n=1 Tax=Tamilnaduibacter salinus TaxID=1484056 RepID=A0A2A2I3N5_9GAMM|nr:hypothetical protein [Tamilnaduibacter salinus]PAV25916.1 hypothetical protein CF392_08560 [Tamilnaduibacter salinus]PVY70645.1 hypothetical protein C8D92_1081 [Tamilnaduibacter salinus]